MRRTIAAVVAGALAALALAGASAQAQEPRRYGQRVGNSYLPSTNDSNCAGLLCNALPMDPQHPTQVLAPPPCEGLICGLTPYGMQRPYTASDAAAAEKARAEAQAQAAAQPAEPAAPARRGHKVRKAKVAKAARTPAPAEAAAGQ